MRRPSSEPGNPRSAAQALAAISSPTAADYAALRRLLVSDVRRISSAGSADAEDVVDESIAKLHKAAQAGRVQSATALAYVRRIARNETIDRARRPRTAADRIAPEHPRLDDDEIARLIDARADAELLEAALEVAAVRRDRLCPVIVSEYLRIATHGRTPGLAELGRIVGCSPTAVRNALDRLRKYISEIGSDEETRRRAF